ncbi:MAG TPA: hypothetical protein VGB26_02075 [Nitrospiria bacterium]|jgi:hypothetical protein
MGKFSFLVPLLLLFLLSCAESGDDEGQNLGNLFEGPGGIIVTQAEHPEGWGRSDCLICHPAEEIHRVNRTGEGTLPLEDIRELALRAGVGGCSVCHGDNGVTE